MRLCALLFLVTACGGSSFESEMFGEGADAAEAGEAATDAATDAGTSDADAAEAVSEATEAADAPADASVDTCTLPAQQTAGDCVVAVCDGDAAILVSDPSDLPKDDGNPCTDEICTTGGPYGLLQPAYPKKVPGTPCGEGKTCSVSGDCL